MKPWSERDKEVLWHPFTQQSDWCAGEPLVIARGEGAFLIDVDGRRYLDGISSLWCNLHGHNHPRLNAAITTQLADVAHSTFLGLTHRPGIHLAERLVAATGLDRVFYSDSGSTAVEVALKIAFQLHHIAGRTDRRHFLHLRQSYHGDTLGAVGVGGIEIFHRVYGPLVVPGIPVPSPFLPVSERTGRELERGLAALDQVLDRAGESAAAFIVEPLIQGAAGMLTHPPGYLRGLADRCRARQIPLIVDEVATGFGRTGTLFACEQEGVTPDFLCLAKGLTGGYLPLAATLTTERVYESFLGDRRDLKQFFHGHTYSANPLACAAALASLDLLMEEPATQARAAPPKAPAPARPALPPGRGVHGEPQPRDAPAPAISTIRPSIAGLGARLQVAIDHHLMGLRGILEIRRVGAMVGIEIGPYSADRFTGSQVCERARAHGVLLRPLGDVLVWMPPLNISDAEIDLLGAGTAAALRDTCST